MERTILLKYLEKFSCRYRFK